MELKTEMISEEVLGKSGAVDQQFLKLFIKLFENKILN